MLIQAPNEGRRLDIGRMVVLNEPRHSRRVIEIEDWKQDRSMTAFRVNAHTDARRQVFDVILAEWLF
jgi:hypothetical protein